MKCARLEAALALATLFSTFPCSLALAAGPDPAAETNRLLAKVDGPAARGLVADPVAKAKAAEQRAQNARGAGDLQHATELDALALTWAQVADDLQSAAAAEKKLSDVQKSVTDLEQKSVRTQALIEQTIARRGRAEQNLADSPDTAVGKSAADKASTAGKTARSKSSAPLTVPSKKPSPSGTPPAKPTTNGSGSSRKPGAQP